MADMAQAAPTTTEVTRTKFSGSFRNMVPGLALIFAGVAAPMMGLTNVFFAAAMAWVFVIWGLFFVYVALMDVYKTYEITEEALIIRDPFRFWNARKEWDWANIIRADVKVARRSARVEDAQFQLYFDVPGEVEVEREDRDYNPEIARAVIDRAQLNPQSDVVEDLDQLPFDVKGVYTWSK